ncbi:hypothetical protein DFH08DRAFT_957566 [Mycena albidolilacea]|uniref:Uncharacterized protein n=1 Tax=Mycena albidolilacea TaxID=1033008 RepID=A0AAD7A7I1_9AGAR|nr:hypothetical protein DFH08DRAFT_957566 [Mycena albidolilacea]
MRNSKGLLLVRDPARCASKAASPIPLQVSQLSGSRPSSYTTEKAGGGVNPPGPTRLASRRCSAPSRALSVDDENPRLTACTAWDSLPALRTQSRASFSIIFFGVVQSGIHESVPTAILAVFSHTPSFSVHRVVPATRLSLGTRSHNRPPFNCNSKKYVQHLIRALGPRHSKPVAAPYRLRRARCPVPRSDELRTIRSLSGHPACGHHVRISSSEALKNQGGVNSHSRPSLAIPPSIQQSRASSDAPDAFSALSTPASLERSMRRAPRPRARSATGALYRSCHAHGLDTTPVRTQIRPRYQLHAQHAMLAFLAAHVASSPPAHCDSSAVYCCRRLRLPYSPAPPPARAMVVPHRRRYFYHLLPRQVRLQQVPLSPLHTHAGRILNTTHTTPRARSSNSRSPSPAPRLSPPTRRHRVQLLTILRSKPAPVRHREYDTQHRRSTQQVQRAFPVARAAFIASPCAATILCAHAALPSKPRPAAHRERDVHHPRRVPLRPSPSAP